MPWNFRLVSSLVNHVRYQDAVRDIQRVYRPAETAFFRIQPQVDRAAVEVVRKKGADALERFLNAYAEHCLRQVGYAYRELVDYLMFRYVLNHSEVAPPKLPTISAPVVPTMLEN